MKDSPEIVAARVDAERRRARVMATAHELQERLSPKVLARDAWQGAKDKGANLAENAVDAVKSRPLTSSKHFTQSSTVAAWPSWRSKYRSVALR